MAEQAVTVLVVDDDRNFAQSIGDILETEGYTILYAYTGKEGVEVARRERPDVMILDVMMAHETEGFEVSKHLAEIPELAHMRVVMVTGIRKEKNLSFGFEPDEFWLPVDAVLEKPVAPRVLLHTIKQAVSTHKD